MDKLTPQSILYGAIVVIYVLVMLAVGYWSMRRTKNVGDFFLGGRSLGPWMSAFAFGTTYFSAVLFIGYAGRLGFGFGIHTMWIVLGNTIIGTFLAWKLLAGRTREMTARLNAITMPEFLRARYDSKTMQFISALVVFIFLVPYSASVYMGLSYLFETVFHIPYGAALIFLALLTGVYLVMGGYFAVAVSDFIRGIVEFVGVLVMVVLLVNMKGGFVSTTTALLGDPAKMAPGLGKVAQLGAQSNVVPFFGHQYTFTCPHWLQVAAPGALILLSLVLITSFGPWSLPQMVQKFYSIRSKADVTRAMVIAGVFALFMSFGAYYSGALTHLFYTSKESLAPIVSAQTGKPDLDMLMPHFITTYVPHWLVLVILLLVFSASMSSLSSLVLVSSSAVAVDIYGAMSKGWQRLLLAVLTLIGIIFTAWQAYALTLLYQAGAERHDLAQQWVLVFFGVLASSVLLRWSIASPDQVKLSLMRLLCAVFVGLSLYIAMAKVDVIVNLMVIAWGTLAGVFLAPYLYGLFWRRVTKAGAFAGIIAGLVTATALFLYWGKDGVPLAGAITMFLPLIIVPIVSMVTPPPRAELIAQAFTDAAPAEAKEEVPA